MLAQRSPYRWLDARSRGFRSLARRSRCIPLEFIEARVPIGYPVRQFKRRHGFGNEVALRHVTAGLDQETPIIQMLPPLGHDPQPQLMAHALPCVEDVP